MSSYSLANDRDDDLTMIPEIADMATEQFLKDSSLSKLALEIHIEPRPMNRRRVTVRVAPKEDIFAKPGCICDREQFEAQRNRRLHKAFSKLKEHLVEKPGCICDREQFEAQRNRRLHKAFSKLKEHLVEMRPVNAYPSAAQYSTQSFYEFGPSGSGPPVRSSSADSATTARQISTRGALASFGHETIDQHAKRVISRRSKH
ncbi:hypothetical protein Tcan_14527 [Toxocara canis]|uniref:Uncharacterized protein n=1 Tax=Toxocara canis TaxID=6265 RepID=A0A0B2V2U0_TOXCA|nr:hypothetical protein Tcan_14527 [Toxocara canis]